MTHDEFALKLRKAMGGKIPAPARETWGQFLKSKGTQFFLNYDWIRHGKFYEWISRSSEVDFGESSHGISVWITEFD